MARFFGTDREKKPGTAERKVSAEKRSSAHTVEKSRRQSQKTKKSREKSRPGLQKKEKTDMSRKGFLSSGAPERQHWRSGNMLYPVPAVMVSCADRSGRANIITIAWTGTICSDPAMVYISVRPQRYSYDMIRDTGEFVINLTTEELIRAADFCGVRSGKDLDKFRECGLTPLASRFVKAPSIAESPVNIECRVKQVIPLGTHDMFLAEVLGVSVDSRYIDRTGKFCLEHARLAAYSHGAYYTLGSLVGSFGFSVRKSKKRKTGNRENRRNEKK